LTRREWRHHDQKVFSSVRPLELGAKGPAKGLTTTNLHLERDTIKARRLNYSHKERKLLA
jgi:hypothetical protein